MHVARCRDAASRPRGHAVDLDDPVLRAQVPALRGERGRLRALRGRLRRADRRGARRGAADRVRPRAAEHRHADEARAGPGSRVRRGPHLRVRAGRGRRMTDVAVVGAGIHAFGRHPGVSGLEMAGIAARAALADAGIGWEDVEFAAGGSDAAGNADTIVSVLGLTGVPFINVSNGCATGGSALTTAHAMLVAGSAEIALVVGFDKHPPGAFNPRPEDWGLGSWYGETGLMLTTQFFAMKIQRYMAEHGISRSTLAKVAAKAFANGARNPNAWRRRPLSEEEVLSSKMVNHPLTQYMFCSPGEGAVALVLASGERARSLARTPIHLRSVAFRTRRFGSFEVFSPSIPLESAPSPTTEAAAAAFEQADIAPGDVDVAQLQDTESGAEVMHLAETGLCAHGEQEQLIQSGATRLDGRLPINTDGGCLATGEPIGASGLRQVHEVVLQLRGDAGDRQIAGPRCVGFTQVYGAPGVSACTVLSR